MKVSVMVPHLSNRAGGLAFSVPPIVRAIQDNDPMDISVLGVADEAPQPDQPDWGRDVFRAEPRGILGIGSAAQLKNALQELQPDVVDVQGIWHWPSVANRWFHRRSKTPYIITPRGMLDPWALRKSAGRKRVAKALFEGVHLKGAHCIRALNMSEAEAIKAVVQNVPVAIIPNAVPLPDLNSLARSTNDLKTLLFLGRIDAKKGVRELVAAWSNVHDLSAANGWRLKIVGWGDDEYTAQVQADIERLGLLNVELAGPAFGDAKIQEYRAASAFVLPSFSEGLPMAVLEAFSYGLPAVLTPFCNLPDAFSSGSAVEIGPEVDKITQGLETLFAMPEDARHAMGSHARHLVETKYTIEHVARQCVALYHWVGGFGPSPENTEIL